VNDDRQIGDPFADELVAALALDGSAWVANAHLAALRCNDAPLSTEAPRVLVDWLAQARCVPPWADVAAIERAQRWASGHMALIVAALFCAALPTTYAAARGARVVHASGRMRDDLDRRVHETGVFLLDVLRPGGLGPSGRGVIAAAKVRLVHAAVRRTLAPHLDEVPINQDDLLGTFSCFSIAIIDALRAMGTTVLRREEQDYLHLWCVVGSLMGIARERLPTNAAEARLVARRIAAREIAPSEHGRDLAERLFRRMDEHMPAPAMRGLPRALAARLIEPAARDALGLPAPSGELHWVGRGVIALARLVGRPIIEAMLARSLDGHRVTFAMPRPCDMLDAPRLDESRLESSTAGLDAGHHPLDRGGQR
jgi:hypothetical protein